MVPGVAASSWQLAKLAVPMVLALMLIYGLVPEDVSPASLRHARATREAVAAGEAAGRRKHFEAFLAAKEAAAEGSGQSSAAAGR